MAKLTNFTSFTLLFLFFFSLLSFTSSATPDPLSPSFASIQKQFWSNNVPSNMPASISSKLSPLNQLDTNYYSKAISTPNFQADSRFCNLAKLVCSTSPLQKLDEDDDEYSSNSYDDTYNINKKIIPLKKVDPFSFFRLSILKEGNTIQLSNLNKNLPYRAFLPPQIASKISLSAEEIMTIFPQVSSNSINTSLSYCNAAAIKGETKACPKSLEEMISFSKTTLGAERVLALTSESTKGSGTLVTMKRIKEVGGAKFVACHELFLPFATYFCHSIPASKVYSVELVEPSTGAHVNTGMAICHMDTSPWPANHVAFRVLKFGPGQGEACHWFGKIDLAWIVDGETN